VCVCSDPLHVVTLPLVPHMCSLWFSSQDKATAGAKGQRTETAPEHTFTPPQGLSLPPGDGQLAPSDGSCIWLPPACSVPGEPFASPLPLG
jgi:hypothetical protein